MGRGVASEGWAVGCPVLSDLESVMTGRVPGLPSLPQAGNEGDAGPSSPKPQGSRESGYRMLRVPSRGGGPQQEPRRQNTPRMEPGMLPRHAEGTVIRRSLTRALGVMLCDSGQHGAAMTTQLSADITCDAVTRHRDTHSGMTWLCDTTTW